MSGQSRASESACTGCSQVSCSWQRFSGHSWTEVAIPVSFSASAQQCAVLTAFMLLPGSGFAAELLLYGPILFGAVSLHFRCRFHLSHRNPTHSILKSSPPKRRCSILKLLPRSLAQVLVHELCHCWMARRCGGEVLEILLWPLGGLAFIGKLDTAEKDLRVAAAGPLSHIPQVCFLSVL